VTLVKDTAKTRAEIPSRSHDEGTSVANAAPYTYLPPSIADATAARRKATRTLRMEAASLLIRLNGRSPKRTADRQLRGWVPAGTLML
jgi:hypothetical protein